MKLSPILTFLAVIVLIYVVLCAALFFFQRSLIYFPQPRTLGGSASTLALPIDGGQVLVTARPRNGPKALLYFGGNAEDVSASMPGLSAAFPGHAIYLMHYRGYGGSSGQPSQAALFADALALFDTVQPAHADVLVIGRSLGSGVAVHLASVRPVARLVLVTPYESIAALAAGQFPFFPVRWLLQDKFESWRYAPLVKAPTLLIAAERDEVIPRASTEALRTHFTATTTLHVVPGTSHNTISESLTYWPLLTSWP